MYELSSLTKLHRRAYCNTPLYKVLTAVTLCDALVPCPSILCASKLVCIIHMEIYPQLAIFQKALLKNSSCKYRTAINGNGPYIEYYMWPKTVESMGLINISKIDPLVFTRYLYIWLANDVSKSSMINASGGVFLIKFTTKFTWDNKCSHSCI